MLCRNLESYSGVAAEIDDQDYLTDGELFAQLISIIRQHHHKTSLRELSKAQKLDLARTLHYDYRCSNGQLRRVIGLTQYEVDTLFPCETIVRHRTVNLQRIFCDNEKMFIFTGGDRSEECEKSLDDN